MVNNANTVSAHKDPLSEEPAIRSLHVLSSGWAEQHREHRYGSPMPRLWWVLTSQSWVQLPISYFLINHRDGPILFDTGLDTAIITNPNYISSVIGRFLLKRLFRLYLTKDDSLDKVLERSGVDSSSIRLAVISHLHFDHVGGIKHIPGAELLVSDREWEQLNAPHPEREWMLKEHIDRPDAHWKPFSFQSTDDPLFEGFAGIFDVAGDGSMILLPTPGHTSGSLSMLIRRKGWDPILLVGDLTYEAALLEKGIMPGTGDFKTLRNSYTKVRQLKQRLPDLAIVPSHDFAANEMVSKATRTTPVEE